MNSIWILLPVLFPSALAVLIFLLKPKEKIRNYIMGIGITSNFFFVVFVLKYLGVREFHLFKLNEFLQIYFKVDKLGIMFALLVSVLWIFTALYAMEYMKHEGKEDRFFMFFSITLGVTLGIAFSGNLITLYFFYEFLTLCTFPLVIHNGSKQALKAGKKYLIYSFGGASLVLVGMILLFSLTNDLSFLPGGILSNLTNLDNEIVLVTFVVMFMGFGVKAALVPFHSWLPSAMVAPTPVSSLLHAVAVVKSGIFALVRMCYFIFGAKAIEDSGGQLIISVFIGLTILMGSFLALHQDNLKKRLAYSTISQLGYILLGIVLLNEDALIGGLLHLINHAVIKITLFFCAGAIMYTTHKTKISEINGIGKRMPITMWCFAISSISLIGIPPTNGFVSKWFLAIGGLHVGKIIFPIILLVSALLTALYLMPVVSAAFFKKGDFEEGVIKEAPLKMLIPIVSITIITILLGLFPNLVIDYLREIAQAVL